MKVALCCIGRLENQYALEFVEYYKSIGFDKIFIYDNNHKGEEHFEEVLQEHINNGFVQIVPFRDRENAQLSAYNDCYTRFGFEFDWMAFFDFDEFLTLVKDKDVKEYLSRFDNFDAVKINWMIYTDNNLVKNDGRPVLERFTEPMPYDKHIAHRFPENNHIKSIIRCKIKDVKWRRTPHTAIGCLTYCNSVGKKTDDRPFHKYNFSLAYLKHFRTKTIDEWINNKHVRGVADRRYELFEKTYSIMDFFRYNKITDEKMEFIKNSKVNKK